MVAKKKASATEAAPDSNAAAAAASVPVEPIRRVFTHVFESSGRSPAAYITHTCRARSLAAFVEFAPNQTPGAPIEAVVHVGSREVARMCCTPGRFERSEQLSIPLRSDDQVFMSVEAPGQLLAQVFMQLA